VKWFVKNEFHPHAWRVPELFAVEVFSLLQPTAGKETMLH